MYILTFSGAHWSASFEAPLSFGMSVLSGTNLALAGFLAVAGVFSIFAC